MVPLPQILVVNAGATDVYSSDRVTFPTIVQQPNTTCDEVGQCRLTVSKLVLKAPTISALEA